MGLISFDFDRRLTEEFLLCGHERNLRDPRFILPMEDLVREQLHPGFGFYQDPGNYHRHFIARCNGSAVGRVTAFINRELHDQDETPIGTIGFYECSEDGSASADLIAAAADWLRSEGMRRIWGPMNFDIWHGYRFITKGVEGQPFCGEPRNAPWYPEQFEAAGFRPLHRWESVLFRGRDSITDTAQKLLPLHQRFEENGFRFRDADVQNPLRDFRLLYDLLVPAFSDFPGITPVAEEDFLATLMRNRDAIMPGLLQFLTDPEHGDVGFSATFIDRADAVKALRGSTSGAARLRYLLHRRKPRRAIYLLGGILPEHARRCAGFGRALVYLTLKRVLELGMDEVLAALMRKGNYARGLFRGAVPDETREYVLYELST